jgi:salicylate hydroxylase
MTESLKIVIVGAGIGGLMLAIGLEKQGIPYTLYEAATQFSAIGAGVGLGPNALRAMAIMDPALRKMYDGISSGNLTPNKEHVAMEVMYAEEGLGELRGWKPAPFGAECYDRTSAHRKDLLDIMTSRINRERVRFGKRVDTVSQDENGVTITFTDGEIVQADLLIGADGVKGPTRQAVLGDRYPDKVSATYSGKYVYRSIAPMKDALSILGEHAGDARTFVGQGVNFITYPISCSTEYNMVAIKLTDEPWTHPQWTQEVTREEMAGDFEGVDERIVKLLDVSCQNLKGQSHTKH